MRSLRLLPALLFVGALAVATACGASAGSDGDGGTRGGTTVPDPPVVVGDVEPQVPPEELDGTVDEGIEVAGDEYQGWILDPDGYADIAWHFTDDGEAPSDPRWLTDDEVARAEAILADDVAGRGGSGADEQVAEVLGRWDEYQRQYLGAEVDGALLVHVNAVCDATMVGGRGTLSRRLVGVDDGGSCFWNATVDVDAGEVVRFSINGNG